MVAFASVNEDEFNRLVAEGRASAAFRSQYARFRPSLYDGWEGPSFQVHHGDLVVDGDMTVPGLATLVLGNLTVGGYVDLCNDHSKGFDEGGLFIVLGSLRCRVFCGHFGKSCFVDGDLTAEELLLSSWDDSTSVVIGHVRTRFVFGRSASAYVGAGADMEYGDGYALPLLGSAAPAPAILPRHDRAASMALLVPDLVPLEEDDPDYVEDLSVGELMEYVRAGKPVFR